MIIHVYYLQRLSFNVLDDQFRNERCEGVWGLRKNLLIVTHSAGFKHDYLPKAGPSSGIVLSKSGEKVFSNLRSRVSEELEIPKSPLTIGPFNVAVLVRNAAGSIKYGVEQRDAAIKAGALGATTLIFSRNKLTMPGVSEDIFQNIQPIHDALISKLKPRENDVIIIGSADEKWAAEFGAKTAALELLKSKM